MLVAKTLVDLRNDFVPLRLFNPTDQPKTVYQNSITAWFETVEEVTEASRPEVQTADAPFTARNRKFTELYVIRKVP